MLLAVPRAAIGRMRTLDPESRPPIAFSTASASEDQARPVRSSRHRRPRGRLQGLQGFQRVGLVSGLIAAPAGDTGKAHGHSGAVPGRAPDAVENERHPVRQLLDPDRFAQADPKQAGALRSREIAAAPCAAVVDMRMGDDRSIHRFRGIDIKTAPPAVQPGFSILDHRLDLVGSGYAASHHSFLLPLGKGGQGDFEVNFRLKC
jgi:hypothetical protein